MNDIQIAKLEAEIDRRIMARIKRDDAAVDRMERRERAADAMIGELSSGKLYVFPVGGKYREGTRHELTQYLLRNGWA